MFSKYAEGVAGLGLLALCILCCLVLGGCGDDTGTSKLSSDRVEVNPSEMLIPVDGSGSTSASLVFNPSGPTFKGTWTVSCPSYLTCKVESPSSSPTKISFSVTGALPGPSKFSSPLDGDDQVSNVDVTYTVDGKQRSAIGFFHVTVGVPKLDVTVLKWNPVVSAGSASVAATLLCQVTNDQRADRKYTFTATSYAQALYCDPLYNCAILGTKINLPNPAFAVEQIDLKSAKVSFSQAVQKPGTVPANYVTRLTWPIDITASGNVGSPLTKTVYLFAGQ